MTKRLLVMLGIILPCLLTAQDQWDLRRAVDYAMANNISVKQSDVQARIDALQTKLAKGAAIPSLNFSTSGGYQFGRNIDPSSNQFVNQRVFFQNYNLQTGVTLFNWFNLKNQVKSAQLNEQASRVDVDRVKNDIGLNVVASYLQLLLSMEQMKIANSQIHLSDSQRILTRKQVNAGAMPELNVAQLESQLALDSSTYITALNTMQQNRLQLIALLALDASQPFDVSLPDVEKIPLPPLAELDPAVLYQIAATTQPLQQVDSLRILAATYNIKAAKASMYPTISAYASIGSQYSNVYKTSNSVYQGLNTDSIAYAKIDGANYPVFVDNKIYNTTITRIPYWKQISNAQLNQSIGLQLNIPIFNGRQARTNYDRARLNLETYKLQMSQDNLTLQQNIYTARSNAETAIQKYSANTKAADYAQYAYDLSKKRYDIGMLSTSEFLVVQNNLATAKFNQAAARYDYIFRIKLLEYYKYGAVQL